MEEKMIKGRLEAKMIKEKSFKMNNIILRCWFK